MWRVVVAPLYTFIDHPPNVCHPPTMFGGWLLPPSTLLSTTLQRFIAPLQCLEGGCPPLHTFIDHPPNVCCPPLNVHCPPSTCLSTTLQTFAIPPPNVPPPQNVPPPPNIHCSKLSQYLNSFRAKGGPRSFAGNQASRRLLRKRGWLHGMEIDLYKSHNLDGVLMVLVQKSKCTCPCLK